MLAGHRVILGGITREVPESFGQDGLRTQTDLARIHRAA